MIPILIASLLEMYVTIWKLQASMYYIIDVRKRVLTYYSVYV